MFYGWYVVASVFVAQMFMVGFVQYAFPFVLVAVKAEFVASTTEANLAMTTSGLVGVVLSPLLGPLADRWSARGLMIVGTLTLVGALLLLSVTNAMLHFVFVFAITIAAANIMLGPITGQAIVSRWFAGSRGKALGIAAVGTSVGGLILPIIVSGWIEVWDWRWALRLLSASVAFFVLPFVLFVLRDFPADKGLEPEGAEDPEVQAALAAAAQAPQLSTRDILSARAYWVIGISFGLLVMSYSAFLGNIGLYSESLGLAPDAGPRLVFLVSLFGLIGKLVLGAATDRIGLKLGLWIALGLAAVALGLFSTEPSEAVMAVGACCLGLAAGGMLPVWAGLTACCFGTASFGRAMGLMSPVIAVLAMPGFMIAGWSADTTGSFATALHVYIAGLGISASLLFALNLDPVASSLRVK